MNQLQLKLKYAGVALLIVVINLLVITRINVAYGTFSWENFTSAYGPPAETIYLPIILK